MKCLLTAHEVANNDPWDRQAKRQYSYPPKVYNPIKEEITTGATANKQILSSCTAGPGNRGEDWGSGKETQRRRRQDWRQDSAVRVHRAGSKVTTARGRSQPGRRADWGLAGSSPAFEAEWLGHRQESGTKEDGTAARQCPGGLDNHLSTKWRENRLAWQQWELRFYLFIYYFYFFWNCNFKSKSSCNTEHQLCGHSSRHWT